MELNTNNKKFVIESLEKGYRTDGRGIYDYRNLIIECGPSFGNVQVQLGKTRVQAIVSCEIVRPFPDRSTEGFVNFNSEISGMSSLEFEATRFTDLEVYISTLLEKIIKTSRAIDTEALCIIVGEQVWSVRCDLHFLDFDGNFIDAAVIAAITSLKHFKRPEVTKDGEEVVVHSLTERAPVPLSIYHTPICVTFSYFEDGKCFVLDPNLLEEKFQAGSISIAVNSNGELCCINKAGGVALDSETIILCTMVASEKVMEINKIIKNALI
ncbi:hypothetical protein BB559_003677 [Furculomyces boomerangus]|uniref:Exosome complex component RRP45 n=2 Tax=Harpellales TaxID=61421 RepID=A0A2T9YJN4_9FUNG|nr:hypothetical protein BB559_003677 [Furculomyces boomerangus]PVZ97062.1 hypothetical protein BB558_007005 [Smittium angustum]